MSVRNIIVHAAITLFFAEFGFAQSSLVRSTLPVDACIGPHVGVDMTAGQIRVRFDPYFGGTPRYVHLYGLPNGEDTSLIDRHPGAAWNTVYETGQDSTQSSANGTDTHPIARLNASGTAYEPDSAGFAYYMRETAFRPPTPSDPTAVYEVTGFAPFFWLSHSGVDDAIAPRPGGVPTNGWITQYSGQSPPADACCNCTDGQWDFSDCGTPIWFRASAGDPPEQSGILFVGDETKPLGITCGQRYLWNQRLCEIPEGRFACQVNISMWGASSNAIAGIFFRREVPETPGSTVNDAYLATGYALNVNHDGVVQVVRTNGDGSMTTIWNPGGTIYAPAIATPCGAKLELRTHNAFPSLVEIYVDGVLQGEINSAVDPNPILGPHFGLFAQTDPGTWIRFSNRHVFDVGLEMVARYAAMPEGIIESDITVRSVPEVISPHRFSPSPLPIAFLNVNHYAPTPGFGLNTLRVHDHCLDYADDFLFVTGCGQRCDLFPGSCPPNPVTGGEFGWLASEILTDESDVFTHWIGDAQTVHGLYVTPVRAEIDGRNAPTPHSILQFAQFFNDPNARITQAQLSPLQYRNADQLCYPGVCNWQYARSQRMVSRWSLQIPTIPPELDCDDNGIADNCEVDPQIVYVSCGFMGCESGTAANPFSTIDEGVAAVIPGGIMRVSPGNCPETPVIDKACRIETTGGVVRIGP